MGGPESRAIPLGFKKGNPREKNLPFTVRFRKGNKKQRPQTKTYRPGHPATIAALATEYHWGKKPIF